MSSKTQNSEEEINLEPLLRTKAECLTAMLNKSSQMIIPYCRTDWDHYAEMCWGPTPAGETAKLPCPDDGFLNPHYFARRMCLSDGSWFVNYTLDDNPYTNFDDCILKSDPSAEADLKKLVDNKVIFILKSMDEYVGVYIILHIISILLLVAAFMISAAGVFKLRQKNYSTLSHITLAVSTAALLINNIVTVSVSAVDDATETSKCRGAKWLSLFSTLIFYAFFLGYIFTNIMPVLRITINPLIIKSTAVITVLLTIILVTSELLLELFSCTTRFCGFRMMQSTFHWLTSFPKLMLIMAHVCLSFVIAFGVLCLRYPHLNKSSELCYLRQKAISAVVLVMYNVTLEILLVLMHTEAYMGYSDLPVEDYLTAFSFVTAAQGIVFSVFMCFFDLKLVAMIGVALKCSQQDTTNNHETNAFQMNPVSQFPSTTDNTRNLEYQIVPHTGSLVVETS